VISHVVRADVASDTLIDAMIQVESGGNNNATGDKNLKHKAYGPLQVRDAVCKDVNRVRGTHYQAKDCLGNRALSIEICKSYIDIYAIPARVGTVTNETMARIWNGGPCGPSKASTRTYWEKVRRVLESQ
jgi:hypothetical protein